MAEEVGVEPTEPADAGSTGFEVRAPHREMSLFRDRWYTLPSKQQSDVILVGNSMQHDEDLETQGKAMPNGGQRTSSSPMEISAEMRAECRQQSVVVANADNANSDLLTWLDEVVGTVEHWTV